jgi:RNA polymerase sigma factor (sigma-70 family)
MSPWLSDLFLRSQSDERLVALAGAGQQRAFTAIVERYGRELQAYARRLDCERAEDLVQQTFLCAFTALQAGTDVRHLRGWLFQILRNVSARTCGSRMLDPELQEMEAVAESAQQMAERRMLALDALAAVAELPGRQHDALVQTALHGRSRTEVAHLMGLSEGAVRQLVHRARETLRTAVTTITPLPLARWLGDLQAGGAGGMSEVAAGAGTASAAGVAGVAVKLGALVATGAVATGVISVATRQHPAHRHHQAATVSRAAVPGSASGANRGRGALEARVTGGGGMSAKDSTGGRAHEDSSGEHSGSGSGERSGNTEHRDGSISGSGPGPSVASSGSGDRGGGHGGTSRGSGPSDGGTSGGGTSGSSDGGPSQPVAATTSDGAPSGGGTSSPSDGGTSGGGGTSTTSGGMLDPSGSSGGGDGGGGSTTTSGLNDGSSSTSSGPGPR